MSSNFAGSVSSRSIEQPDGVRSTGTDKDSAPEGRDVLAFVYGTLTDPGRVSTVVDEFAFEGPAILTGFRRIDGRYPTLAPGRGGLPDDPSQVDGRLLRTDEVAALDAYEGVDRGLYVRAAVPVAGRDERATVYVGHPDRLEVGEAAAWPGEGAFEERVRRYVEGYDVLVHPS